MEIQDLVCGDWIKINDPKKFLLVSCFGGTCGFDDGNRYRRFTIKDSVAAGLVTQEQAEELLKRAFL